MITMTISITMTMNIMMIYYIGVEVIFTHTVGGAGTSDHRSFRSPYAAALAALRLPAALFSAARKEFGVAMPAVPPFSAVAPAATRPSGACR